MSIFLSELADTPSVNAVPNKSADPPRRFLIVRLSSMGDVLHTMPAVALLRQVYPDAEIGWIIEERWAELLCAPGFPRCGPRGPRRPLVDAVHAINTLVWRKVPLWPQTRREVAASWRELRSSNYEQAIDFQGSAKSAALARLSRASQRIGFQKPREHAAAVFYTRTLEGSGTHVIEQAVALAAELAGVEPVVAPVEFPTDPAVEQWCDRELHKRSMGAFAIVNPGAGWGAKQWPAERYGNVAKALALSGLPCLINFGPGEQALARAVELASDGAAEPLQCSVSQLIALTRRARLFIGGDTGPMHLAAALKVPVVGIFGPTNPARNGPFGTRSIVLRSPESATTHARHKQPEAGLLTITAAEVIEAARNLLGNSLA